MARQLTLQEADVTEQVQLNDVNVTLYISEYKDQANQTQELKVVYQTRIDEDGNYQISIASRRDQEGAAASYLPGSDAGRRLGTFQDYEEAKDAMRQYFYQFFTGGKTKMGANAYGRVVEQKTSGTQTDPSDDDDVENESQKLRNALTSFKEELEDKQNFYEERIDVQRQAIQETMQEIQDTQQQIQKLRNRKAGFKSYATRKKREGDLETARQYWAKAGAIETNKINPIEASIQGEKQEIASSQKQIQEAKGRRDQLGKKINEVEERIEGIDTDI